MRRRQRALDNLAPEPPETSAAERQRIALGVWENLGRAFCEFFHMPQIMAEKRIALEPIEDLSLTRPKDDSIKIGAKVVSNGRYVAF